MTQDQLITELRVYIARHHNGRQIEMAKALGVSGAYLSYVMNGRKEPSGQILRLLGLKKEVIRVVNYVEAT